MDVNVTVSLMRGQMGTVIEKAVTAAVETVLGEMLKVVSVKFEEFKRDMAAKEKENESIRQMLEISRCQMKSMRKYLSAVGNCSRIQDQRNAFAHRTAGASAGEATLPQCLPQVRISSGSLTAEEAVQNAMSKNRVTVPLDGMFRPTSSFGGQNSHTSSAITHQLVQESAARLMDDISTNGHFSSMEVSSGHSAPLKEEHPHPQEDNRACQGEECETMWDNKQHPETLGSPQSLPKTDVGLSTDSTATAGRVAPLVAKEEEAEVEIICIKEEPEEVFALSPLHPGGLSQGNPLDITESPEIPRHSTAEPTPFPTVTPGACEHSRVLAVSRFDTGPSRLGCLSSEGVSRPTGPPRQPRAWVRDLSLYEEYKSRKAELRRRSQTRRRELEKNLPQPLLADLVRERREKTRLRVARWRAKRKLQACLVSSQPNGTPAQTRHGQRGGSAMPVPQQFSDGPGFGGYAYSRSLGHSSRPEAMCAVEVGTHYSPLQFSSNHLLPGHTHNMLDNAMEPVIISAENFDSSF